MLKEEWVKQVNQVVKGAGKLLAGYFQDPEYRKPMVKEDGSPVTQADLKVSEYLIKELSALGFPVVSEEGPLEVEGESYFIVDPLDGTKYFVKGESQFVTCVGFIESGVPTYGAVYDPINEIFYHGVKGQGAWKNGEKISHPGAGKERVAFSRGFHKKPQGKELMKELSITEIRKKGAALKFCAVAEGEADLFPCFGPTGEWDTAAAQVILEESNCTLFVAQTGEVLGYGKTNRINPEIIVCHQNLKQEILTALAKRKTDFSWRKDG